MISKEKIKINFFVNMVHPGFCCGANRKIKVCGPFELMTNASTDTAACTVFQHGHEDAQKSTLINPISNYPLYKKLHLALF